MLCTATIHTNDGLDPTEYEHEFPDDAHEDTIIRWFKAHWFDEQWCFDDLAYIIRDDKGNTIDEGARPTYLTVPV